MTKILTTGSAGILGSAILRNLNNRYIFLNLINKKKINIKYNQTKTNIFNKKKIDKLIKGYRPEIILHCAAITNIESCEKYKKKCKKINYDLTKILVNLCKKNNIRFIFISTDQVYSKNYYQTEKSLINCYNYYTKTKFFSEKYIQNNLKNFLILRTNFFGKSKVKSRLSFSDFIISNLMKKKKIYLFDDVIFNPINIDNFCKAISYLIDKNIRGLYNIGSYPATSKYKFGIKISKKLNLNSKLIIRDSLLKRKNLSDRPLDMRMSLSGIKKIIKDKNLFSLNKNLSLLKN